MPWQLACLLVFVLILVLLLWRAFLPSSSFDARRPRVYKGEEECRAIFEAIYRRPFPRVRPNFLRNPLTGRNLELDGYNEGLAIAFEYNGKQHYIYPNRFHKSEEEFLAQRRRDKFKQEVCSSRGIVLVVIPYTVRDKESFIRAALML